jgi:hypothetical protein
MRLSWEGPKVKKLLDKKGATALMDAAEVILEEANRAVPLDESTLMKSGETSVDIRTHEAAISYDTPYAVRLHEHPEYNFQGGRRGKWLELTLKEQSQRVLKLLAEGLQH